MSENEPTSLPNKLSPGVNFANADMSATGRSSGGMTIEDAVKALENGEKISTLQLLNLVTEHAHLIGLDRVPALGLMLSSFDNHSDALRFLVAFSHISTLSVTLRRKVVTQFCSFKRTGCQGLEVFDALTKLPIGKEVPFWQVVELARSIVRGSECEAEFANAMLQVAGSDLKRRQTLLHSFLQQEGAIPDWLISLIEPTDQLAVPNLLKLCAEMRQLGLYDKAYDLVVRALDERPGDRALINEKVTLLSRGNKIDAHSESEVVAMLERVDGDSATRATILQLVLATCKVAPAWLIHLVRSDDTFSPGNALKISHGMQQLNQHDAALVFVTRALAMNPDNQPLWTDRVALELRTGRTEDFRDAVATKIRMKSYQKHMETIYGEYANALPSMSHKVRDSLFPDIETDGVRRQAQVLSAFAAMITSQLFQLRALRNGEIRETSVLADWGVASYSKALAVAEPAVRTAFLLLYEALRLDFNCRDAFINLAKIHELRGDALRRLEALEQAARLDEEDRVVTNARIAALCDIGELEKALNLARSIIQNARVGSAKFVSFEELSAVSKVATLIEAEETSVTFIAIKGGEHRRAIQPVRLESLQTIQLHGVSLVGNNSIVDEHGRAYLYDTQLISIPSTPIFPGRGNGGFVYRQSDPIRIEDKSVYLLGLNSHFNNYYHALIQNFSRIPSLSAAGVLKDRRFVVPSDAPAWSLRLLGMLGIEEDQYYFVDAQKVYCFEDLVVPTPAKMTSLPPVKALMKTRSQLGVSSLNARAGGRKIFWSRQLGNANRRPLVNETELQELAKQHGFIVVDPASLTPNEQISMLSEAEVVAGSTGAAFANLLFAPPGVSAICFAPRESAKSYYPSLGSCLNQNFVWCLGEYLPDGRNSADYPHLPFHVDCSSFTYALELLGHESIRDGRGG